MTNTLTDTLHSISQLLLYPVIGLLLVLFVFAILMVGSVIVEYLADNRTLRANMPALADELHDENKPLEETVAKARLLKRQKKILIEISKHTNLPLLSREALAYELLQGEKLHYSSILKPSEIITKISPMLGLMGTLIPLGPGILALGKGNTEILADSLMVAFDTTIIGLLIAAVTLVITVIRKRWYNQYNILLEALVECVIERMKLDDSKQIQQQ